MQLKLLMNFLFTLHILSKLHSKKVLETVQNAVRQKQNIFKIEVFKTQLYVFPEHLSFHKMDL